jgi:hypothetical protein
MPPLSLTQSKYALAALVMSVKSVPGCWVTIAPILTGVPLAFFPLPRPHLRLAAHDQRQGDGGGAERRTRRALALGEGVDLHRAPPPPRPSCRSSDQMAISEVPTRANHN